MEAQLRLFETIEHKHSDHFNFVKLIAEILDIEIDSVYRRKRGTTPLSMKEASILCQHFGVSMDAVLSNNSGNAIFRHTSLDMEDMRNYYKYIEGLSLQLKALSHANEKEILFSVEDIPIFHFMPFTELTLFKIYTWYNTVCKIPISYEQFVRELDIDYLKSTYDQLFKAYLKIPSKEIWTKNTINAILSLLDYYYDIGKFESKETPILLCKQLLELLENVVSWADKGVKSTVENGADFQIYLSPVNLENSLMLIKNNSQRFTHIKMYTINSIVTSSKQVCDQTEKWILNTISKSSSISSGSERERIQFFQSLKKAVNKLLNKFESEN